MPGTWIQVEPVFLIGGDHLTISLTHIHTKMDEHVYGVKRKKFSKDLFEEHFGQIDGS